MMHSGRYFFRKTIMGNQLSRDTWIKASNEVTKNLDGVFKLVDNLLIGGRDCAQLAERLEAFLARCQKAGMTIASKKVQVGSKVREAIKKRLSFGQCRKGWGRVQPESKSFEEVGLSPILTTFRN